MDVKNFMALLGADFYTGVPDSQLKALCNALMATYGIDAKHHVIAANEGNAVALAAGYHLATGRVPVVYLQNSGEGNIINPVASLCNNRVYAIPMLFIVGWRGEPGVPDEPQHIYQGEVTVKLLETMDIDSFLLGPETTEADVQQALSRFRNAWAAGRQTAFVIRKGALTGAPKVEYKNSYPMTREEILRHIVEALGPEEGNENFIVSTTGKCSRELFELREARHEGHGHDFLTVGSMGHSSSIALGVAAQKPDCRIWCIDGDGALLMHMGAAALIGANAPENLVHVLINNEAHETVGGMPTVAGSLDAVRMAETCGYRKALRAAGSEELDEALRGILADRTLTFLEVKAAIGAREDLGRPTTTAVENKKAFMEQLNA